LNIKFYEYLSVVRRVFTSGQTERRTDGRTDTPNKAKSRVAPSCQRL